MFLCRNTTLSSLSGEIRFLLSLEMKPAVEKTLSEDADVAEAQRYFLATLESFGYCVSFAFHHNKGFSFNLISGSMK